MSSLYDIHRELLQELTIVREGTVRLCDELRAAQEKNARLLAMLVEGSLELLEWHPPDGNSIQMTARLSISKDTLLSVDASGLYEVSVRNLGSLLAEQILEAAKKEQP